MRRRSVQCGDSFITVHPGRRWTSIEADFVPAPEGALAFRARETVIAGAAESIRAGRTTRFWIKAGPIAHITVRDAEALFATIRERHDAESAPSGIYRTVVPASEEVMYVARFEQIAKLLPPVDWRGRRNAA